MGPPIAPASDFTSRESFETHGTHRQWLEQGILAFHGYGGTELEK